MERFSSDDERKQIWILAIMNAFWISASRLSNVTRRLRRRYAAGAKGGYLATVQVIPHVTNEIKERIKRFPRR
jgi:hypothetical protein